MAYKSSFAMMFNLFIGFYLSSIYILSTLFSCIVYITHVFHNPSMHYVLSIY